MQIYEECLNIRRIWPADFADVAEGRFFICVFSRICGQIVHKITPK